MAPHSCTLAWKISWTEEPGGLQSVGSQRVRLDLAIEQHEVIPQKKGMSSSFLGEATA